MTLGDLQLRGGVDRLDLDRRQRLPECARRVRQHEVLRLAVERDDGDLGRARLHDLEIALGEAGVDLLDQQRLLGGDLGALHAHHLGHQVAAGIERGEAARAEQTLETAVARQEGALVILDDNSGEKGRAEHVRTPITSSSMAYTAIGNRQSAIDFLRFPTADAEPKKVAGHFPTPLTRAPA